MSVPNVSSWVALKRLCRYFAGAPRLVYRYRKQKAESLDIYTDTDWAGCARTRKSTSGGVVMLGRHTLKHWSSTQATVTLSSGEAEFHGLVKGAGIALGQQALLADLGVQLPIRLWTDSSAAIGICSRQGLGKLRHVDTKLLWVQQAVRAGKLAVKKVAGLANPADLFTKHSLSKERILDLVHLLDCHFLEGRASAAPAMREGTGTKRTMADAEAEGLAGSIEEDLLVPTMPHLCLDREQLDRCYPSVSAPGAVDDPDLQDDALDATLQHGYSIASDISTTMDELGRARAHGTKRMSQGSTYHNAMASSSKVAA